jgi:diguanylate cyclase (GGDEF)-like protein
MLRIRALTDELADANRRLAELADLDGLTGIANRRRFDQLLSAEFNRAERYARPLSVTMIDIDHFKRVNDTYGHPVGDRVIRAVAQTIAETLRQSDRVARLGGEEFGIVTPEVTPAGALALGERLRKRIEELTIKGDTAIDGGFTSVTVTVSIGIAAWDGRQPSEAAQLLKRADEAMYRAKESGRNRAILVLVTSGE